MGGGPGRLRARQIAAALAAVVLAAGLGAPGSVEAQPQSRPGAAGATKPFRSRNYTVTTDLPEAQAREIARHMDEVFDTYARRFSGLGVKNASPIKLYLFGTNRTYLDALDAKGFNAANTGGVFFYNASETGLATFVEGQSSRRMLHVLQHEGFHQFAHLRIGSNLPMWANEGMAEYFGYSILVKGKLRTGVAPEAAVLSLRAAVGRDEVFPLAELMALSNQEWNANVRSGSPMARMMYAQSWAVVHFLIHAEKGRYADAFSGYITRLATGMRHEQALADAFGVTNLAPMERAWRKFVLEEWEPDPLSTAADRVEFIGEGIKALVKAGRPVGSLDEIRQGMRAIGYRMTVVSHGQRRIVDSADDANFQTPQPTGRTGRQALMDLTPPSGGLSLPGLRVTGLGPVVRLSWTRAPDGDAVSEISFD